MIYQFNFLSHIRALSRYAEKFRVFADFDMHTFQVSLRGEGRTCKLTPRYMKMHDGRLMYTESLSQDILDFAGWLPYKGKRWKLSDDKLSFKRYCSSLGLRTPRLFLRKEEITTPVLLKRSRSSFGENIEGPFQRNDATHRVVLKSEGDFCEEFIPGRSAKAWYWDGKLACLGVQSGAAVTGDGIRTVKELLTARGQGFRRSTNWRLVESWLLYQGKSVDSVLPRGEQASVDFRHGSALRLPDFGNPNVLREIEDKAFVGQLRDAGPMFWRGIPEDIRQDTAFTVDAVIDDNDQVWFLEMNSNPALNPDLYAFMLEGLFGPDSKSYWETARVSVQHAEGAYAQHHS